MANLAQFLRLLERADVSEIAFQTGAQPAMAVHGKYVPISSSRVTTEHILSFLDATPFVRRPPGDDDAQHEEVVRLGDKAYTVVLRRQAGKTLLRYRPAAAVAPASGVAAASAPAPAPVADAAASPAPRAPEVVSTPKAAPHPSHPGGPAGEDGRPDASDGRARLLSVGRLPDRPQPHADLLTLFRAARERRASDLHLSAGRPASMRCGGTLRPHGEALSPEDVEQLVLSVMDNMRRDQLERLGYADFSVRLDGVGAVRGNVGKQSRGLKGSFRLAAEHPPSLEELGLPPELSKITMYHQGLAVVSGPNGHGKTTTLAALVQLINVSKASHIITVEDPVEVFYPVAKSLISQREVGVHTHSFERALKGALREDPDVIVIGELRDLETVEIALEAAETGHLVIATMSTRSGAKTIDRLIDMFPPDKQSQVRATLAGALKLIVSQRLVPTADGEGLVAAFEMITGNVQLWNLIRDNKLIQLPSLMQRGRSLGMIRLDESLAALVSAGRVSEEVALRMSENPTELKRVLTAAAPAAALPKANAPEGAATARRR